MVCGNLLPAEMRPESCFCTLCPWCFRVGGRCPAGAWAGGVFWCLYFPRAPLSLRLCAVAESSPQKPEAKPGEAASAPSVCMGTDVKRGWGAASLSTLPLELPRFYLHFQGSGRSSEWLWVSGSPPCRGNLGAWQPHGCPGGCTAGLARSSSLGSWGLDQLAGFFLVGFGLLS